MRRITWIAAIIACISMVLAGCGTKDAGSVVKELGKVADKTESYQGSGVMTLHTGEQPLEYKVDIKFQKPSYYRIALTNEKKDITQIVLRNDEGVFVLTPKLNKVFRFQSDWPENQGQVYLYQTLLQSILLDNSRQFAVDKDSYVFDVMANYTNASLARQKIWLSKSDYAPRQVEVSDSNAAVMVDVKFDKFDFNPKFDKSVFDTQANLKTPAGGTENEQPTTAIPESDGIAAPDNAAGSSGSADDIGSGGTADDTGSAGDTESGNAASGQSSAADSEDGDPAASDNGTIAPGDDSGSENAAEDGQNAGADASSDDTNAGTNAAGDDSDAGTEADGASGNSGDNASPDEEAQDTAAGIETSAPGAFVAMEPSYLPEGVALKDMNEIVFGGNAGVMLRYEGTYNYSLIETQPMDNAASIVDGTMVDLGYTLGLLSGDEQHTLTWTYQGTEYRLTSGDMPDQEMIAVAQSVMEEMTK
ncbi:DUF4367 domain-containing protein [Paenibacillus beijingensis]|uniref:Uncharacterized protein n=1 Tax=Paenibacillus beijingensis TaxID=1126833 RepID=A0A0D5NFW3_9BACL|nr:DUF4367 domain-containing protein [Paenibacillus beijingensis]AJY73867.1 hypothetical protein VN24_03625 [Paenibacillus beijingensis]